MKWTSRGLGFPIFNLLFFAAAMVWPAAVLEAKYSGGLGEPNDPYQIGCAADLLALAADTNDYNKCFILTTDINLSAYGTQFNRIGTDTGPAFGGVFDGNRHTIRGLTYKAENGDCIGIFGCVNAAGRIENVSLVDVNITGLRYVGGLAGYNEGTISNCYSTATVAGKDSSGYIGGLSGGNSGSINRCYSTGTITSGIISGGIGGLVGENVGNISNCYSSGTVASGDGSGYVGGLAGNNSGSIGNCYSTSTIINEVNLWNLGGLIGENDGDINNCYFLDSEPNNGYGEPLTDEQMKQKNSFVSWDFVWETVNGPNDIWAICEGVSYPKLNWQFVPGDSDNDKDVDFADFGRIGLKWRQADANLYCGGTDLTGDGWTDWKDMVIMCDHWLEGF
jgi:hypothetical protein